MAKRYKFWDKKEDLFVPSVGKDGKGSYTAEEAFTKLIPWARRADAVVVISQGPINGATRMNFFDVKNHVQREINWRVENDEPKWLGYAMANGLTGNVDVSSMDPQMVLDTMEWLEDNPPAPMPDPMERLAAAVEFQNMLTMANLG